MWRIIGLLFVSAVVAGEMEPLAGSTATTGVSMMLCVALISLLLVVIVVTADLFHRTHGRDAEPAHNDAAGVQ